MTNPPPSTLHGGATPGRQVVTRRSVAIALAVLAVAGMAWEAGRGFRRELGEFDDVPATLSPPEPVPSVTTVRLTTHGGRRVTAWYAPSTNGAGVVLTHGSDDNRGDLWPELKALNAHGFAVLAFDWPGRGESDGPLRMGTPEREAFTAAVDYLAAQPGVERVGAYGFSMGAALVTVFGADDPRVRALALAGNFTDALDQIRYEYRHSNFIARWGAVQANAWCIEGGNLRAIDAAPRLKGRPTLFVVGTADEVVSPEMSRALATAAEGEFWLVEGANHGNYAEVVGGQWHARLEAFFDRALGARRQNAP